MSLVAENVRVAVTGAVYAGPLSATLPTNEASAVTGFTGLGYVSDGGVTESRDRSSNQIRAWQNSAMVREVVTESSLSYSLTLIETTAANIGLFYGTSVSESGGKATVYVDPGSTGGRRRFVIDVIDGDSIIRTVLPDAEITEVGDQVYAAGEPIGFELTITAYSTTDDSGTYSAIKYYAGLPTDDSSSSSSS